MHLLVCIVIISVVLLDFVRVQIGLPRAIALLPEALSGVALLFALNGFTKNGLRMPPRYVLLFSILLLSVTAGLFIADATIGPLVGGIRIYGKYIPFLLLPIAAVFTEKQLRQQCILLLGLMLLQFPITFAQRFILFVGKSGDMARGTFTSGTLNAIVLLSTISVVLALYYQKRISGALTVVLCSLLFLPPTIAEVKGAFLLAPLALLLPAFFAARSGQLHVNFGRALLGTSLALAVFASIYSYTEATRVGVRGHEHRTSLVEFISDPRQLLIYLAPKLGGAANEDRIGRIDGILEPLSAFSEEPLKMATGLGIGAVSLSPISILSADQHLDIVNEGRATVTMSYLLWEFGLLGTALILMGMVMTWNDARYLQTENSMRGALALGWTGVVPIFLASMFWKNTLANNAVMYLFAYFSGHVISGAHLYRAQRMSAAYEELDVEPERSKLNEKPSESVLRLPPLLNEVRP